MKSKHRPKLKKRIIDLDPEKCKSLNDFKNKGGENAEPGPGETDSKE